LNEIYNRAAEVITNANYVVAFTGAGISVESGIPPFRGDGGIWNKYNPEFLEIGNFLANPVESWKVIRKIFFEKFTDARPNEAHRFLARLEKAGRLKSVITQNIDNLHQVAGSEVVLEFHGNSQKLLCLDCHKIYSVPQIDITANPPSCPECGGLLKPDFVFFGETIPETAHAMSVKEANKADVLIIIGTTGEVMPAAAIPHLAKINGAMIIEINPQPSNYTNIITDIFIQSAAATACGILTERLGL